MKRDIRLPIKVRKQLRNQEIKALYRKGYSMDEICAIQSVSKTTVFFAIKGRSKKGSAEKIKNNNKNKK